MVQHILPFALQVGGEIVKEAAHLYLVNRYLGPTASADARPEAAAGLSSPAGCPYCAIAKHLSHTYLYLKRLPSMPSVYLRLAVKELHEADTVAAGIASTDPAMLRLQQALMRTSVELERPGATPEELSGPVAAAVWQASDIALTLAEKRNGAGAVDHYVELLEDMARRLHRMGSIDGEFREVKP